MSTSTLPLFRDQIPAIVSEETSPQRLIVDDWHTHLLGPQAGPQLCLYGIDQQLAYHYVRRKLFAAGHIDPATFYSWSLEQQGDFTWQKLFADAPSDPFDEGCRGVVVALEALGLDPNAATLDEARQFYADTPPEEIQRRCMELAGVRRIVGTQDVFNDQERTYYGKRRVGRVLSVRLPPRRTRLALPARGRKAQRLGATKLATTPANPPPPTRSAASSPTGTTSCTASLMARARSRPTAKSTTSAA